MPEHLPLAYYISQDAHTTTETNTLAPSLPPSASVSAQNGPYQSETNEQSHHVLAGASFFPTFRLKIKVHSCFLVTLSSENNIVTNMIN